jgi:hypothetical protein
MSNLAAPSDDYLRYAFNRTKLAKLGYTFESAMQCPAIQLCLTRVAQAIARPVKQTHMRGAQND